MKNVVILFFLTLFIQNTKAKNPLSFTLEEAKAYALEHTYEIKNADYDIELAKKNVWKTIAIGLPQISAEANYTNSLDIATQVIPDFITPAIYDVNEEKFGLTPLEPQGDVEYFPAQFGQQYAGNYSLLVSQLLFKGDYIVGVQAAKIYLQLSKDKKEKTALEIKELVTSAYYTVIVAKENLAILKQELKYNEKLLYEVEKLYENGFREETDVLQLKLIKSNSENTIFDAERAFKASKNLLKFIMGIDINTPITASDKLETLIDDTYILEPTLAEDEFLKTHIDLRFQQTNYETQEYLLKSMYAEYLPSISAFYTYRKDAYNNQWNIFKDDWYKTSMIGLKFSLPIFKSGMQKAKIKQQKLTLLKLENDLQQITQKLKKDNIEAYDNLITARNKFENARDGLKLAKTILNRTTIMFNEGIANSPELSQREQQHLQSLNSYIYATLNLLNAKKTYLKSIGKL